MSVKKEVSFALALVSLSITSSFGCESAHEASPVAAGTGVQGSLEPNAAPASDSALPSGGDEPERGTTELADPATPSMTIDTAGSAGGGGRGSQETETPNVVMLATGGGTETGAGGAAMDTSGSNARATFHVFLLLGQSNMAGYPKAQQADRVEDPRIKVLGFDECAATGRHTDAWDVAAPPLHECWNDGLGPGDYFAKTLLGIVPEGDTIGLVPCAISGERIETFMKVGGTKYDWILQRARLAREAGGVIEGLLFHQGESNSGDPSWPGKVSTFVTDLRTDLGVGEIPFLAGELLYSGGAAGHNTRVNQLPSVIANARVISASGLVVDPVDTQWNLHFDHDSQVEFGKRYARAMIEALGW